MKTKNKIGPSTDPCCTPEVTVAWEDFSLSKTTVCDLFDRNALIQWRTCPRTPVMKLKEQLFVTDLVESFTEI